LETYRKPVSVVKRGECLSVQVLEANLKMLCRFLSGLEQLQVSKRLREDLGGGWKEFTLAEAHNFHNVEELTAFLSSQERQAILAYLINGIRAEKGDAVADIHFREGEAIGKRRAQLPTIRLHACP
jgi:hypothetical protein